MKLSPSEAVVTDQSYNGGFMAGRIASIFVSKVMHVDINKVARKVQSILKMKARILFDWLMRLVFRFMYFGKIKLQKNSPISF